MFFIKQWTSQKKHIRWPNLACKVPDTDSAFFACRSEKEMSMLVIFMALWLVPSTVLGVDHVAKIIK